MTNVHDWDTSAGGNNLSPPDGFPEGMAPGSVNDAAREVMAAVARWFGDVRGILTTGGTGNAYTLTTNRSFTPAALASVQPLFIVRVDRAPTGAATLNVDATGAKPWRAGGAELASGDLPANSLAVVSYNATNDEFESVIASKAALNAASDRVLFGRALGAGPGPGSFLTDTEVRNIVGEFTTSARGIVPASGTAGSRRVLRSDGWADITGFVQPFIGSTAPNGWLLLNGDSIGSAASAADQPSDGHEVLFRLFWNSMSDAQAPVSGGRGVSAQADWDANKTLTMPDSRGRTIIGSGTGPGLTARTHGDTGGDELSGIQEGLDTGMGDGGFTGVRNNHRHDTMQPWLALNYIVKI